MSIRKKPDQAVPVLLARLHKAKQYILQRTTTEEHSEDDDKPDSLQSKFKQIEEELQGMNKFLPKIKRWEQSVTEQFCQLEQALDDDDVFKDPEMEAQVEDKLHLIAEDIKHLKDLINKVNMKVERGLTMMSIKPKNQDWEEEDDLEASQEWKDLQIEFKIFESESMSSLFASFHCVESSQVKICLLCLSIFPENSVIKKRPLIYWWIGEGLVAKTKIKTAEEVGEEIFHELLDEGFIKSSKDKSSTRGNCFCLDPWIRRMLILAAKKNGFLTFGPQWTLSNGSRRAFLLQGNDSYNINGEKVEELSTVFNIDEQYLRTEPEWLEKLKKVEVLQLGRWRSSVKYHIEVENSQLLNGLGSQKHLKYLSLRGISRIENLPISILKLISLKILDLRACHNLEKLPQGISALKNLTHLDVSECFLLESMPKGIDQLTSLQVLKGFVIGRSGRNYCKIIDLIRLENLRKLSIRICNESEARREDQLLNLEGLSNLRSLTISWGVISSGKWPLHVPSSLRKLDLRCAPNMEASQVELKILEKLYITGGSLDSLGHLQSTARRAKYIRLKYLKYLSVSGSELETWFPEYLRLEKIGCHERDLDVIKVR